MKESEQNFTKKIGGYFATEEVMREVLQNPDYTLDIPEMGTLVWGFGIRQEPGQPAHSVYCFAIKDTEVLELGTSGGVTREDAIKGLSRPQKQLLGLAMQQAEAISKDTKPPF